MTWSWEVMGDELREAFELLLSGYVERYLGHMEVEEKYVLAVAHEPVRQAQPNRRHGRTHHISLPNANGREVIGGSSRLARASGVSRTPFAERSHHGRVRHKDTVKSLARYKGGDKEVAASLACEP